MGISEPEDDSSAGGDCGAQEIRKHTTMNSKRLGRFFK
jgi:hypothetical protein